MLRLSSLSVAIAMTLFASSPALAETPGGDTIVLKSGGLFRGTLVDVVPNDHARIRLETGEIASVPWSEIDHIAAANAPASAPPVPSPPAAAKERPQTDRAFVHINGDAGLRLERGSGRQWATVCTSPCDTWLPLDGGYRIAGDGVRSSKTFALAGASGERVDLDVDPASKSAFVGGIVATSVGYGAIPIGLMILVVGALFDDNCDISVSGSQTSCSGSSASSGLVLAGGLTMLVGALVGTVGVFELVANVHSPVAQSTGTSQPAEPAPVPLRLPSWNDTPATMRVATPAVLPTVPVYTLSF